MADRMFHAFSAVQDNYLREAQYADAEARHRHVQWLRAEQERVAGEAWDQENRRRPEGLHGADAVKAALTVYAIAEDVVIAREIIGRLPARLVHEVRNAWAYRESEFTAALDPAGVDTGELSTIHWYDRAAEAHVDVAPVGNPDDYCGFAPIEDVALAPRVHWTEADKKKALEEAVRIYGLEPGQWMDLDWPPRASLYSPGSICHSEFQPCVEHAEIYYGSDDDSACDACPQCQDSVRDVVEQTAQWTCTTTLRINEIGFDTDGQEHSSEVSSEPGFEVATIEQDPRELLVGPPGEGRSW